MKKQNAICLHGMLRGLLVGVSLIVAAGSCGGPSRESTFKGSSAGRPLIGITSTIKDRSAVVPMAYAQAVRDSGGVPVILPAIDDETLRAEYVRRLDGLILIGGDDVPPSAYGETPHKTVEPMPAARWAAESKLVDQWLATGKPVLGICLGLQLTNVVRGGSLVQDLPSEVGRAVVHAHPPENQDDGKKPPRAASQEDVKRDANKKQPNAAKRPPITHQVALAPDSRLRKILGVDQLVVVSSHHQAAKRLGRGLHAAAHSDDGAVEALEIPEHPWAEFVQWHPERMDRAHQRALFGSLIRACQDVADKMSRTR
ncbi:MAG: gamma-glutamyl-gamma-aminobutyrate hydrolase family protein [Pirellulales bacterium]|nr:gamma-glutamyl-gamma-aminobutyrate hydrolase family protein [Pirellulales bacterium]